MSSGTRLTLAVALVMLISTGVVAAATAVWVHVSGTVDVEVHERGGSDISLTFPAPLVQAAIACVPRNMMGIDDEEATRWIPLVASVVRGIDRMPDAVLVEVHDGGEDVVVEKKNGRLTVRVRSADDDVRIGVPIAVVRQVAEKI